VPLRRDGDSSSSSARRSTTYAGHRPTPPSRPSRGRCPGANSMLSHAPIPHPADLLSSRCATTTRKVYASTTAMQFGALKLVSNQRRARRMAPPSTDRPRRSRAPLHIGTNSAWPAIFAEFHIQSNDESEAHMDRGRYYFRKPLGLTRSYSIATIPGRARSPTRLGVRQAGVTGPQTTEQLCSPGCGFAQPLFGARHANITAAFRYSYEHAALASHVTAWTATAHGNRLFPPVRTRTATVNLRTPFESRPGGCLVDHICRPGDELASYNRGFRLAPIYPT